MFSEDHCLTVEHFKSLFLIKIHQIEVNLYNFFSIYLFFFSAYFLFGFIKALFSGFHYSQLKIIKIDFSKVIIDFQGISLPESFLTYKSNQIFIRAEDNSLIAHDIKKAIKNRQQADKLNDQL